MTDNEKLLREQLYSSPPTVSLDNLCFGDASFRNTAPYALEALCPNQKKMRFFQYAAVVCQLQDFFACLVFGIDNNNIFPYAGHFLVQKEKLRDPKTEEPPKTVKCLPNFQEFEFISLFGVLNQSLARYTSYFLHCPCPEYENLLNCSQVAFFSLVNRSKNGYGFKVKKETGSKEKNDTSLAITDESMQRILRHAVPLNAVKQKFKESARFHGQVFSLKTTTRRNSISEVIDCNQLIDRENRTNFFAAYEEPGGMPFFETSLLLGQLDSRYIVGVRCSNAFYIIATKRIYDRSSGQLVAIPDEIFQSLNVPDWVDENQALSLLETRQILGKPDKYRKQVKVLRNFFQFDDHVPEKPSSRTCKKRPAPKAESERIRSSWTKELLDETFSSSFQNSMLEFPDKPSSANNPGMFCLNIVRLWIQEVLRIVHGKELGATNFAESPLLKYFGLSISEFIDEYLPLYGLSPDCVFQCRSLDSHGDLEGVCAEALPANAIGGHVLAKHIGPLLEQTDVHFVPFMLIPPPYVTLSNSGDVSKLEKCRAIVQQWAGTPYIDILRQLKALVTRDDDVEDVEDIEDTGDVEDVEDVASIEGSSSYSESVPGVIVVPPKRIFTQRENSPEEKNVTKSSNSKKKKKKHANGNPEKIAPSPKRPPSRTESDADRSNVTETNTPKRKIKLRKRQSFEMQVVSKIMKERNVL